MSGPVQLLVIGFDEASYSGTILAELDRLRAAGLVRLVDVLLVRREEDGTFDTLPPPPGADPRLGEITAGLLGGGDEHPAEEGWSLADLVEPGAVAAVALIEHTWATGLMAAIASAGGRPLGEMWLSPEDRSRLPG